MSVNDDDDNLHRRTSSSLSCLCCTYIMSTPTTTIVELHCCCISCCWHIVKQPRQWMVLMVFLFDFPSFFVFSWKFLEFFPIPSLNGSSNNRPARHRMPWHSFVCHHHHQHGYVCIWCVYTIQFYYIFQFNNNNNETQ